MVIFVCLTCRGQISLLVHLSVGGGVDARHGPHHVHPANLYDGAARTAARPHVHGQQRNSEHHSALVYSHYNQSLTHSLTHGRLSHAG